MSWYWWLLIVALIPLGLFVLKILLSFSVSQSLSGAALLKQELRKRGVPCDHLTPAFYAECIEWAERVAAVEGRGSVLKRKASFVESIESLANTAELWLHDPQSPMFTQFGNKPNTYRRIFERHNLRSAA